MQELAQAIPDPDAVLALEPEELGAKLLLLLRGRLEQRREEEFHPRNMESEVIGEAGPHGRRSPEVGLALAEGWAWVKAQGLIVPAARINGSNGWRRLSRRARRVESEADLKAYASARRLPKEALHPKIASTVWAAFMRGEFEVAVFQVHPR